MFEDILSRKRQFMGYLNGILIMEDYSDESDEEILRDIEQCISKSNYHVEVELTHDKIIIRSTTKDDTCRE
jgi:hypothetical protein